ncbi:MAG: universal stress protein [Chloroflexota bacterium]
MAPERADDAGRPRFVVGVDGREGGWDAVELTRTMAAAADARVLVVAAIPYGPLPISFTELAADATAEAEPLLAEARGRLDDLEVETRAFGGGSAAWVISDIAEAEDIELIVVGSPHRGALGRALIGSVADNLLHGAECPVVVAPRGYASARHEPFRRIAVAYDGTPEAKLALRHAEAIAARSDAAIEVLTVVAPPVAIPGIPGYAPIDPPNPDRIVAEAVDSVDGKLAAQGRRLDGPPAATLAEACEDGVDLLVAGSRGYGPAMRVLLGSVSTQLIHRAPCPVLVVPRP